MIINPGTVEVGWCDVSEFVEKVYGEKLIRIGAEEMHKGSHTDYYQIVRRMVVKHKSEWNYKDTDYQRSKVVVVVVVVVE